MVTVVAAASLILSACSIPVALSQTRSVLGGGYLQIHFSVGVTAPGVAAAKDAKFLQGLTFSIDTQTPPGAPFNSALSHAGQKLTIWRGATHLATLIDLKSNLFLRLNFTALAQVPGVRLSASEIAAGNLFLGGRWIEIPDSLVVKFASPALRLKLKKNSLVSGEYRTLNDLVSVLARGPVTTTATGYSETGTLASLGTALSGVASSSGPDPLPSKLKGSYSLSVTKTGTQPSSFNFSVTVPRGTLGAVTTRVAGTIAHRRVQVKAPDNPLVITSTLLRQLGALAGNVG